MWARGIAAHRCWQFAALDRHSSLIVTFMWGTQRPNPSHPKPERLRCDPSHSDTGLSKVPCGDLTASKPPL